MGKGKDSNAMSSSNTVMTVTINELELYCCSDQSSDILLSLKSDHLGAFVI